MYYNKINYKYKEITNMGDELKKDGTEGTIIEDPTKKYIDALEDLKKNSVSIEDYQKLKKENEDLFEKLKDGSTNSTDEEDPYAKVTVDELRKSIFQGDNNNLEFWQKSLILRDKLIKEGQNDPFLPVGHDVVPTDQDVEAANRVAEGIAQCIKYAQGDPVVFTNELQRITVDNMPAMLRQAKR